MLIKVCGTITVHINKYIEVNDNDNPFAIAENTFGGLIQNADGSITTSDPTSEKLEIITDAKADFVAYDNIN